MKVLITGGAGYMGNELVFQLINNPEIEKIIIYDNLSRRNYNIFIDSKYPKDKVEFIRGELLDTRKLKASLTGIDVVYHLAAKVSTPFASEDSHLFEQINHWGTAELVYAIENSSVSKLIYTSSTAIYGESNEVIDINTTPNPITFYATSKFRGEEHVKRLIDKIPTYILRCGNIYGYSPSLRFDAVINRFMFDANFIGRIQITGNGNQNRAFIHVDKAVDVLTSLIINDFPSGIYNLIDKNLSVLEIANVLQEIYPKLEMLYVNQHLILRELRVMQDVRIKPLITLPDYSLKEELLAFKDKFSFGI